MLKKYYIFVLFISVILNSLLQVDTAKQNVTTSKIQERIIGGNSIAIAQAPWQASIRLKQYEQQTYGSGFICSGTVISQKVVVTTANCMSLGDPNTLIYPSPTPFLVVVGSVYLYEKTSNTLEYDVTTIIVHPGFNLTSLEYNIALIFINGNIPTNWPTVQPILLNYAFEANGTMCATSGWGDVYAGYSGTLSSALMAAQVPVVNYNSCNASYGNLTAGVLCAGYMTQGGIGACRGDTGDPLVCNGALAGIMSYAGNCGQANFPAIYTNISYYRDWIVITTENYNSYNGMAARNMFTILYTILPMTVLILRKFF